MNLKSLLFIAALLLAAPQLFGQGKDSDPEATSTIAVKNATNDEAIRQRLEKIFSVVDELKAIEIEVQSGVVTLSGKIADSQVRQQALDLVKRTEGVVMTVARFEETAEVGAQLSPALSKLRDIGRTLMIKAPLIAVALLTVGFFWWLGAAIFRRKEWFDRLNLSSLAKLLVRRLVRLVVTVIGIVLALEMLDATAIAGAILGAAGLAGLALGFAFKNIMENYLSGILLSTRNPFEIGDVIDINGSRGKVALLTSRDTVLVTLDGNHLRIPNSVVINSELLNFTRNPRRRFDFSVGVSVDLDLNEARRVGLETFSKNPAVLGEPKPVIIVDSLGDSTVVLKFFAWMDQREHDYTKTRSESIRLVKVAYDQAGIEMPEPIYRVVMREGGPRLAAGEDEGKTPAERRAGAADLEGISTEDLSADRTIDEQIAEEQKLSKEKNLLPPSEADAGS